MRCGDGHKQYFRVHSASETNELLTLTFRRNVNIIMGIDVPEE